MLTYLNAIPTLLVPVLVGIVPGLLLYHRQSSAVASVPWVHILLTSITTLILMSYGAATLHVPIHFLVIPLGLVSALIIGKNIFSTIHTRDSQALKQLLWPASAFLLLYAIFAFSFMLLHDGLPTGDSQKAIYWAERINENNHLPQYSSAIEQLSRDPVDFYTPGLHTLTAAVMRLTTQPLMAVGFLAIVLALATTAIAAAFSHLLDFPNPKVASVIIALLLLTNFRFLRYLREPGYHYQNIAGELLLFGLLYLALRLLKKWSWPEVTLAITVLGALLLTHQFSAFVAFFMLLPVGIIWSSQTIRHVPRILQRHAWLPLGLLVLIATAGIHLGLAQKIPHIFSSSPHLTSYLPSITDYFNLLGATWLVIGVGGFILLFRLSRQKNTAQLVHLAFGLSVVALLLLTQGPRLFIDIPPTRALLYLAVPFSITGTYFLQQLWLRAKTQTLVRPLAALVTIAIITSSTNAVIRAFAINHDVAPNSTLTTEEMMLISRLRADTSNAAVVTDDYNQRSASWLILGEHPIYTRLASDIARPQGEASQSPLRYDLYQRYLDFEKIYNLASLPLVHAVAEKHNIQWLVGHRGTSAEGFFANNALTSYTSDDTLALFSLQEPPPTPYLCAAAVQSQVDELQPWLLRTTTIINDIGDKEDTFKHLPISLRATRLSSPQQSDACTYRSTTAPAVPILFNVEGYVKAFWNQNRTNQPDTSLELFIALRQPVPNLVVQTPTGDQYPLDQAVNMVKLASAHVPLDENGFIELQLLNTSTQPIEIDIIALGLARTP